jgi:hypothetical protein
MILSFLALYHISIAAAATLDVTDKSKVHKPFFTYISSLE